jgi:hypothetical protein
MTLGNGAAPSPGLLRHPGLVPGSTGLHGEGRRLTPFPSPQSEPRNESGVTAWVGLLHGPDHAARLSSAVAASAIRLAMMSAIGSSLVTMPTDWPAITLPCSTSPSITARRSAPAQ